MLAMNGKTAVNVFLCHKVFPPFSLAPPKLQKKRSKIQMDEKI